MISVHFIEGENWNRTFWLWTNKQVHHKASQASSYVRQHNNLVSLLNTGMNQRNNHMRKILNTHMQIQIQTIKKKKKKKRFEWSVTLRSWLKEQFMYKTSVIKKFLEWRFHLNKGVNLIWDQEDWG